MLTPPLSSGCLPGITRELLLEEIRVKEASVHERTLLPAQLEEADEVFITSTTRDLLPVRSIEGLRIKYASPVCESLRRELARYRADYITNCAKLHQKTRV